MDTSTQISVIMFSPLLALALFQLSSYLGQTILSTHMRTIEIEDVTDLSGLAPERIRMVYRKNYHVKYKVLDEQQKQEIGHLIFNEASSKIIENHNIPINNEKLLSLRKNIFSRLTGIPFENIRISADGDTFEQVEYDKDGNETVTGSVSFDPEDYEKDPLAVSGNFKKMF